MKVNIVQVMLGAFILFFPTLVAIFFLGRDYPLVQPSEVWRNDLTQAAIQSYIKLSKLTMLIFTVFLILTLFIRGRWRWFVFGLAAGGLAGAIVSRFLIPFYI